MYDDSVVFKVLSRCGQNPALDTDLDSAAKVETHMVPLFSPLACRLATRGQLSYYILLFGDHYRSGRANMIKMKAGSCQKHLWRVHI